MKHLYSRLLALWGRLRPQPFLALDKQPEDGLIRDALELEWTLEDKAGGNTTVRGVAKEGNKINLNGRYFPTDELSRMVDAAQADLKAGKLVGVASDIDHFGGVPNVAIKFTGLRMDGDLVRFEGEIVDTTSGQNLKAVLRSGVTVGMSTVISAREVTFMAAKDLDPNHPYPEEQVVKLSGLTLRRIDPVLNPADEKGQVKSDAKEPEVQNLQELKEKYPHLVSQLVDEVKAGYKPVEDALTEAQAKIKGFERAQLEASRKGLVKAALEDAKLPKLGKAGELDLDQRFADKLEAMATQAESDKAAADVIAAEIAERKALVGHKPNPSERQLKSGNTEDLVSEGSQLSDSAKAELGRLRSQF